MVLHYYQKIKKFLIGIKIYFIQKLAELFNTQIDRVEFESIASNSIIDRDFDPMVFQWDVAAPRYNILALLEVARPDLALTNKFIFWTIPADTVRLITEQPNLVGDISFRAARSNKIKQKYSTLTSDEKTLLHKIITRRTTLHRFFFV